MAIIVVPSINVQTPSKVTFDSNGLSNQLCSLDVKFNFINGVNVDVAVALQIINLKMYRFEHGNFVIGSEVDNCVNGQNQIFTFRIRRIVAPTVVLPGCSIRIITWDKTSTQQKDKRIANTTFKV